LSNAYTENGKGKAFKFNLIICSVALFVITVGFSALFNLNSFDKLYIESNVSKYRIIGKDLQRKLERGLLYGKNLQHFIGIDNLLSTTKNIVVGRVVAVNQELNSPNTMLKPEDITISVANRDGTILYSDNRMLVNTTMPKKTIPNLGMQKSEKKESSKADYVKYENTYITTLPIADGKNRTVGFVVISFEEKQIKAFLEQMYQKSIKPILIISVSGLILLIGLLSVFTPSGSDIQKGKKRISLVIFTVICAVQISTSAFCTYDFRRHFLEIANENNVILVEEIKHDIEYLLSKGIRIDRMLGLEGLLGEILSDTPEIKDITIFDRNNQPLFRASAHRLTDFQRSKDAYPEYVDATKPISDPEYSFTGHLKQRNYLEGVISINTSKDILFKKIADIGMDSLTVIVISILFLIELLILIFKYVEWEHSDDNSAAPIHYGVMRPAAFLFLFGIDISISFLPLHMETLYVPILGLSKDTIMGLPISVEFLFVGIAILASGI